MSNAILNKLRPMSVRERDAFLDGLLLPIYLANRAAEENSDIDAGMASAIALGCLSEAIQPILERLKTK